MPLTAPGMVVPERERSGSGRQIVTIVPDPFGIDGQVGVTYQFKGPKPSMMRLGTRVAQNRR